VCIAIDDDSDSDEKIVKQQSQKVHSQPVASQKVVKTRSRSKQQEMTANISADSHESSGVRLSELVREGDHLNLKQKKMAKHRALRPNTRSSLKAKRKIKQQGKRMRQKVGSPTESSLAYDLEDGSMIEISDSLNQRSKDHEDLISELEIGSKTEDEDDYIVETAQKLIGRHRAPLN